jgi:hypothetical protein
VSVAASAKARLVGVDGVLADLMPDGVKVRYAMPTKDVPRDLVYGGRVSGPIELSAMAAGARVKRTEELTLQLHVRVYRPNGSRETTDGRAVEIGNAVANYIAANWKLGELPELIKATVDTVELDGWTDDEGSGSVLDMAIGLQSYLT